VAGGRCSIHGGAAAIHFARWRTERGLPADWRIRKVRMTAAAWLKRQAEGKAPSIQSIAAREQWRRWRAARGLPPDWRYAPIGKPAEQWLAEQRAKQGEPPAEA
jgi:hypothetical protein